MPGMAATDHQMEGPYEFVDETSRIRHRTSVRCDGKIFLRGIVGCLGQPTAPWPVWWRWALRSAGLSTRAHLAMPIRNCSAQCSWHDGAGRAIQPKANEVFFHVPGRRYWSKQVFAAFGRMRQGKTLAVREEVGLRPRFGVACERRFRLGFDPSGRGVAPKLAYIRKNAGCYWHCSDHPKQKTPQAQGFTGFLGLLRIAPN
jgi:hypothetical protein